MIVLKLYYHLLCLVKTLFYKLIYSKSFIMPLNSTYCAGVHLIIGQLGGKNRGTLFL